MTESVDDSSIVIDCDMVKDDVTVGDIVPDIVMVDVCEGEPVTDNSSDGVDVNESSFVIEIERLIDNCCDMETDTVKDGDVVMLSDDEVDIDKVTEAVTLEDSDKEKVLVNERESETDSELDSSSESVTDFSSENEPVRVTELDSDMDTDRVSEYSGDRLTVPLVDQERVPEI